MDSRDSHSKFVKRASEETSETPVDSRDSHSKFVRRASDETSETPVELRDSPFKFVRRASAETSRKPDIPPRFNSSRAVNFSSGEKSDIALLLTYPSPLMYSSPRSTPVKATACSSPARDFIPRLRASSLTRLRMECVVTGSLEVSTSSSRMAAAKFGSGMETGAKGGNSRRRSRFQMEFFPRDSLSRFVKSDKGERFVITLLFTHSPLTFLAPMSRNLRLCACSSPMRDFIPRLRTESECNVNIACVVMASLTDNSSASRTAAAKFGSGIETTSAGGSREATSIGKLSPTLLPSILII